MSETNPSAGDVGAALIAECKNRLMDESLPRVQRCLDELTDEEIWTRPNDQVVSVGNLVLHLCGNVRQWVISTLGGQPDSRERDEEFAAKGPLPRAELVNLLEDTMREVEAVLDRIEPAAVLDSKRVQGFDETVLLVLIHVTEHFSYHTGQISLHVKLRKNIDLGYYAEQDLNAKG